MFSPWQSPFHCSALRPVRKYHGTTANYELLRVALQGSYNAQSAACMPKRWSVIAQAQIHQSSAIRLIRDQLLDRILKHLC
jgi:hypothetical protein